MRGDRPRGRGIIRPPRPTRTEDGYPRAGPLRLPGGDGTVGWSSCRITVSRAGSPSASAPSRASTACSPKRMRTGKRDPPGTRPHGSAQVYLTCRQADRTCRPWRQDWRTGSPASGGRGRGPRRRPRRRRGSRGRATRRSRRDERALHGGRAAARARLRPIRWSRSSGWPTRPAERVRARWAGAARAGGRGRGWCGCQGATVAYPAGEGERPIQPADGVVRALDGDEVIVALLPDRPPAAELAVVGCDPAFGIVADAAPRSAAWRSRGSSRGSRGALEALARGEAHVAGAHLVDPETGACERAVGARAGPVRLHPHRLRGVGAGAAPAAGQPGRRRVRRRPGAPGRAAAEPGAGLREPHAAGRAARRERGAGLRGRRLRHRRARPPRGRRGDRRRARRRGRGRSGRPVPRTAWR
jgi:hypothetical protein